MVLRWRNDPAVSRYMYSRHAISWQEHMAWFQRCQSDPALHPLLVELGQQPIGFANIRLNDQNERIGTWGFYLAPDAPKGSGNVFGNTVISYAFKQLGLHQLIGEALVENAKSMKFHLRMGFSQEKVLKNHYYDGDRYHDVAVFVLLNNDSDRAEPVE